DQGRDVGGVLPGLGAAAVDAVAVDGPGRGPRAARDRARDPERRRRRRPLGRYLAVDRDRRRRDPTRALHLRGRRAAREKAREAEALGLRVARTAAHFTPERHGTLRRRCCRLTGVCRRRSLRRRRRLGLFVFFKGGFGMAQVESRARATSDPDARRDALKRLQEENVDFLLLWFTDIEGHLKSFAVTPAEVEEALNDGMGFDGSSITGFNAIEESDMVAIPDPSTFQLMPAREGEMKMARMICDIVTPDGNPYEGDPRYVLRRALERMSSLGFDAFNVGPELEYFLFRDDKGTETLDEGGYFAMTTMDAASGLRQETVHALESMGIPIEYVHHEVGPSQHEIDMRYAPALEMADHTVTYRLIVKEIAKKAGYHATFMPKPIFGENGSGMHT